MDTPRKLREPKMNNPNLRGTDIAADHSEPSFAGTKTAVPGTSIDDVALRNRRGNYIAPPVVAPPPCIQYGVWVWRSFTTGEHAATTVVSIQVTGIGYFQQLFDLPWSHEHREETEQFAAFICAVMNAHFRSLEAAPIVSADVPQLDRVFIGKGEYVRADEATKTIMDLQRNLRHWREECGKLHARIAKENRADG